MYFHKNVYSLLKFGNSLLVPFRGSKILTNIMTPVMFRLDSLRARLSPLKPYMGAKLYSVKHMNDCKSIYFSIEAQINNTAVKLFVVVSNYK